VLMWLMCFAGHGVFSGVCVWWLVA